MGPWILPFGLYMVFIALASGLDAAGSWLPLLEPIRATVPLWMYPVKTAVVLGALLVCWRHYTELRERFWLPWRDTCLALVVGVVVYLAWVRMAWPWAMQGQPTGYNPWQLDPSLGTILAGIRIFGATFVVPVMEELFWRSFLLRYLVAPNFLSVRLGAYTPLSFGATVLLFGLEHHLWLAGMMAGVAYTLVLYKTQRLWPCIVAHAVTNGILGVHVLVTQEWHWW